MKDFLEVLESYCFGLVWFREGVRASAGARLLKGLLLSFVLMEQASNVAAVHTLICLFSYKLLKKIRPLGRVYLTDDQVTARERRATSLGRPEIQLAWNQWDSGMTWSSRDIWVSDGHHTHHWGLPLSGLYNEPQVLPPGSRQPLRWNATQSLQAPSNKTAQQGLWLEGRF